jgi:nucleoside-diphosphate-sugar epimerase
MQEYWPFHFDVEYTNEYRIGEVLESVADISSICSSFDWVPKFDIDKGLKEMFKRMIL